MSVDRPPKRKTASKRDSVSPKTPSKVNQPKSRTAKDLEALLHLLDEDETSDAALGAVRKTSKPASDHEPRPAGEQPPPAIGGSSFMQELARARADLHKERRSRIASEEEAESLRRELARLTANDSAKVDELQRQCEGLQEQLAALKKQRQKLQGVRFDLESELVAEQKQRELLNDQVAALNQRLATECSRRETIAADLEATQQACERRTIEADAASSAWEAVCDELRAELASMTLRCEQAVQARDALQAAAFQQQSELADLTERIAAAETKVRERDELIHQTRNAADDVARSATKWEERFQHEYAKQEQIEQRFPEQVSEQDVAMGALDKRVEAALLEVAAIGEQLTSANSALEAATFERTKLEQFVETAQRDYREAVAKNQEISEAAETTRTELTARLRSLEDQLADANQKLAESAASEQRLRAELTDARHEKQKAAVALDEMTAANERLESRAYELETELAASNQLHAKGQDDSEVVNEQIERLQADVAKAKIALAESYEQLGVSRLRLANVDRDCDRAERREAEALRRASELSDEVKSLQACVQREAAARRKAAAVHKREAGSVDASALFEAEQKIERLSCELAACKASGR